MTHRGISEDKPPKHTTSPRKDAEISENYRKPAERNHSKEISTSPANALKIPSQIFAARLFVSSQGKVWYDGFDSGERNRQIGSCQTQCFSQLKVEFDNSTYGSCTRIDRNCRVNHERRHIFMNQIDTGKFIAGCRKEKGLTQAQLAEKLNITDRAVSKWETGKCMPDSSIMLELCNILGVTVNELLSGERIEINNYDEKVNENLIELKRKDENNMNKNAIISTIYTIAMIIGIMVCCICDIAISGTLTWSLIVLSSILVTWITSFPVILLGKRGVLVAMIAISIIIVPFMYILSILIKVNEVFSIGAIMSIISLAFLWIIYALYYRLKERKFMATGITFLFAIPFTLLINSILSKMIGEAVIDIWDILSIFILLIIAVAFIIGDYARRKGHIR